MSHVHLPDIPRHVSRRKRHLEPCCQALSVNFINVLHPHRHPYALVPFFVSIILERSRVLAPAAASLCSLTQKNLACTGTRGTKPWRRAPVPELLPSPLLKPCE